MSILTAHERRLILERIDRMKISIADLRSAIDLIFKAEPTTSDAMLLAEADIHLGLAAQELDAAQQRFIRL